MLVKLLVLIAAITIAAAIVLGIIGHQGGFNYFSQDFSEMFRHDELRPARFLTVFGIHLGGYAGGLIGLLVACGVILRRGRRSLSATQVL